MRKRALPLNTKTACFVCRFLSAPDERYVERVRALATARGTMLEHRKMRPPATRREGFVLCVSSFLGAGASAAVALSLGETWLAWAVAVQGAVSVNFWRKPAWGARRTVDVCCATLFLFSAFFVWAEGCEDAHAVRSAYLCSLFAFAASCATWVKHAGSWVFFHASFHLIATVANVLLYACRHRERGGEWSL